MAAQTAWVASEATAQSVRSFMASQFDLYSALELASKARGEAPGFI